MANGRQRDRAAALSFARSVAGFAGDALPGGIREDASECPLARALGPGWMTTDTTAYEPRDGGLAGDSWRLPDAVSRFVTEFDRGGHPDLESGPKPARTRWRTWRLGE